jgi:hypothetical protein
MNPETRTLVWRAGELKFPCGVRVKVTAEKIQWVFKVFKYEGAGREIVEKGQTTIPKSVAFHIKSHLTD